MALGGAGQKSVQRSQYRRSILSILSGHFSVTIQISVQFSVILLVKVTGQNYQCKLQGQGQVKDQVNELESSDTHGLK